MSANFIGLYLVEQGAITPAQLDEAIARQRRRNRRIGDMAVARGLLTRDDVEHVFSVQHAAERPFGEIALELGLLGRAELDELLFSQNIHNSHLGEVLLEMGALTLEQFGPLLDAYHSGERSRTASLRGGIGDDSFRHAADAMITALTRAFLRFLGEDVKPAMGNTCPTCEPPDGMHAILLGLPDGRRLEFLFLLPGPLVERLKKGVHDSVHPGLAESLRGQDAFFVIVLRYVRMIAAGAGHVLRNCRAERRPFAGCGGGGSGLMCFSLATPGGTLLKVTGHVLDGSPAG